MSMVPTVSTRRWSGCDPTPVENAAHNDPQLVKPRWGRCPARGRHHLGHFLPDRHLRHRAAPRRRRDRAALGPAGLTALFLLVQLLIVLTGIGVAVPFFHSLTSTPRRRSRADNAALRGGRVALGELSHAGAAALAADRHGRLVSPGERRGPLDRQDRRAAPRHRRRGPSHHPGRLPHGADARLR